MPFCKADNGRLNVAPTRVNAPGGVKLTIKEKETYRYPAQLGGWSWFDDEEEARKTLKIWADYATPTKIEQTSTGTAQATVQAIFDEQFILRFCKAFQWNGSGSAADFFYSTIKTLLVTQLESVKQAITDTKSEA